MSQALYRAKLRPQTPLDGDVWNGSKVHKDIDKQECQVAVDYHRDSLTEGSKKFEEIFGRTPESRNELEEGMLLWLEVLE